MTLGFPSGSKNFCKLLCVSWEVFVSHGYAWIHWVAKSCTTTAYRWLFRDSQFSLRTLWSAVIKSPNFSARGTASPLRLLHGAIVILVFWQISQFRSLGNEHKHCAFPVPLSSQVLWKTHEKSSQVRPSSPPRDSLWILATILANQTTGLRVLARCPHFYWVSEFLAGSGDKSPCACSLTFSLRVVARRIVEFSESCDDDVGDVGVAKLEEPVNKPGTTSDT